MHFYCHFENNELTPWTHNIELKKESPVVELDSFVPEKKALQENSNLVRKMYGGGILFGAANLTHFQNPGQA